MVRVVRMKFPHDLVWDDALQKIKYLGKFNDKIGHPCPIGMNEAGWCLSVCQFARSAPYIGGLQMVCAYEAITRQSINYGEMKGTFGWNIDDYIVELADGIQYIHQDERLDEGLSHFKPSHENPYGFNIDGLPPWELGLVEKPDIDPRVKRPRLRKDKL